MQRILIERLLPMSVQVKTNRKELKGQVSQSHPGAATNFLTKSWHWRPGCLMLNSPWPDRLLLSMFNSIQSMGLLDYVRTEQAL